MSRLALLAFVTLLVPPPPASVTQDLAVTQESVSIGVRNAHGMVFDPTRGQVLLYGGADATRVRGDTWAWDGERRCWSVLTMDNPDARTFPALAFDETRQEAVLFGGNRVLFGPDNDTADTVLGDTWVLRSRGWVRVPAGGPGARAEAAMAYDRRRRVVVLFGGYSRADDARVRHGDTWEWNGARWLRVATDGPAPRNGAALAFDESRGTIVLSGGPPAFVGPDTWEWNGQSWRQVPESPPPARFNPAMVYHAGLKALIRFGGWTGQARASDTWVRGRGGWRRHPGVGPSPRNHTGMAYDAARGRAVLFGGHDGDFVLGDTWEFDGQAWRRASGTAPARRIDNSH